VKLLSILGTLPVLISLLNAQMYDPFHKTHVMKKSNEASLLLMPLPPLLGTLATFTPTTVTAVMNNKAFINGEWYKVGDKVNTQEIASIQPNFVTLKEGNRLTMLGVGTQQKVLQTKEAQ
jgi:hypothetical protein